MTGTLSEERKVERKVTTCARLAFAESRCQATPLRTLAVPVGDEPLPETL